MLATQATEFSASRTSRNSVEPSWLRIASIAAAEGGYMNGKTRPSFG